MYSCISYDYSIFKVLYEYRMIDRELSGCFDNYKINIDDPLDLKMRIHFKDKSDISYEVNLDNCKNKRCHINKI